MSEDRSGLREGVEQAAAEIGAGLIAGPEGAAAEAVGPIVEAVGAGYDLYQAEKEADAAEQAAADMEARLEAAKAAQDH